MNDRNANDRRGPPPQAQPQQPPPARRGGDGAGKGPREGQTVLDWAHSYIAGSFLDPREAAERLKAAGLFCHVVGGASVIPLKIGHEVVITVIGIDESTLYKTATSKKKDKDGKPIAAEDQGPEKFGIGGSTLMKLGAAASIEWMKVERTDNRRDIHYCSFRAVGRYMTADGTYRTVEDAADSDFRDNSPQLAIKRDGEVPYLRANIVRSTATKAQLRVIRKAFGVPHSMTRAELDKPFVFARLMWTGRSEDPEVAMMFARVEAQKQLIAHSALFGGGQPGGAPMLTAVPDAPQLTAAAVADVDEENRRADSDPPPPAGMPPGPGSEPGDAPPPVPPPTAGGPTTPTGRPRVTGSDLTIGKERIKIRDAQDKDLAYWEKRIARDLDEGTVDARYLESNREKLAALREEIALRKRGGEVPGPASGGAPSPEDARRAAAIDQGEDDGYGNRGDDPDKW